MILTFLIIVSTLLYASMVLRMRKAWISLPEAVISDFVPNVSIVVVFRNEAQNLHHLLEDVNHLETTGNKVELVLINDGSDDNGAALIEFWKSKHNLDVKVENLYARTKAHKKEGIELGIANAKYEYVVVTDADCRLPKQWLKTMITVNPKRLRCGPVSYLPENHAFSGLLELELMALSAMAASTISMGKPVLANAANMAYCRSLFFEVGGYRTKEAKQSPSGDDIALIKQVKRKHASGVQYVKHKGAIVETRMPSTTGEFISQRIRWAGKTRFDLFKSGAMFHISMISVYVALFVGLLLMPIFNSRLLAITWVTCFLIKFFIDRYYFKSFLTFFNKQHLLRYLPASEIFHLLYVIPIAVASLFIPYKWKGRVLKHGAA